MKSFNTLLVLFIFFLFGCTNDSESNTDSPITQNPPKSYTLTGTVSPMEGGSISPSSGMFDEGTVLTLEGIPSNGYSFKEWTGSIQSTKNPLSITMDTNMNVTGVFEKNNNNNPIYLDENGITIKCYDWGNVGDTGEVNGITYTIVNRTMLEEMINNDEDVTVVCTSKISDMRDVISNYYDRVYFNQEIGSWDVSNVTHMGYMFFNVDFNRDISSWNVSNVTIMTEMFMYSTFNQPIGNWDVSNVSTMNNMFSYSSFNQDISSWNVVNVTEMVSMFEESPFNQPIGDWNVGNVTSMYSMFYNSQFNQPINNWNVDNVTDFGSMFYSSPFNQDISSWNVSKVTRMESMFSLSRFNQPIETWDVGNVTNMGSMFKGNSNFNQDLSGWGVSNVNLCSNFSTNTPQWTLPKPNFTNCTE